MESILEQLNTLEQHIISGKTFAAVVAAVQNIPDEIRATATSFAADAEQALTALGVVKTQVAASAPVAAAAPAAANLPPKAGPSGSATSQQG